MAITYGSDFATSASLTSDGSTPTLTLGSTGANSILFVLIEANSNYSTPLTITYNGVALTSLGGKVTYTGTGTAYKELWYLIGNLTSGQTLSISSGSPTTLGQTGSQAWSYRTWTYGGVSSIGTTSIDATNFTTNGAGSPVSVAFNFTPSSATSSILQILQGNSVSTTTSTYASTFGTMRRDIVAIQNAANGVWIGFSDYAPGSTSLYSLSQSFNPNFTSATGWGWGVELLPAGSLVSTQIVWVG